MYRIPAEAASEICGVLRWLDEYPGGRWEAMGKLFQTYERWRHIIECCPSLVDRTDTMFTAPHLTADGRLFLLNNSGTTKFKCRGRKKANRETELREEKLAADWEQARDTKVYKADFAKQRNMNQK